MTPLRIGFAAVVLLLLPSTSAKATTLSALPGAGQIFIGSGISNPCVLGYDVPTFDSPLPRPCTSSPADFATFNYQATLTGVIVNGPMHSSKANGVEVGTFSFSGSGTITGACGSFTGTVSAALNSNLSIGTKTKDRYFSLSVVARGDTIFLTGTTNKGELLTAAFHMMASGGSCSHKGSKSYNVAGTAHLFAP